MNFEIPAGKSLTLRLRNRGDAEAFYRVTLHNRPILLPYFAWAQERITREDTEEFIALKQNGFCTGNAFDLGIWHANQWIGSVGFSTLHPKSGTATIGYWLSKDFQKLGLATQAVEALIDYGFETRGLTRIEIHCATHNEPSKRIPIKLGFWTMYCITNAVRIQDQFQDSIVYGMSAEHWRVRHHVALPLAVAA